MDNMSLHEQLDRAIQALLAPADPSLRENGFVRDVNDGTDVRDVARGADAVGDAVELAALSATASALQGLPSQSFKSRLKADLERSSAMASTAPLKSAAQSAVREGFRTVTPYLSVKNAPALVEFLKAAFGAKVTAQTSFPHGGIHAELQVGDSMVMLGGGPNETQYFPTSIHLKVDNVDDVYARALRAGATSLGEPRDFDYGERGAAVKDGSGNVWYLATPKGQTHFLPDMGSVTIYLHPRKSGEVIDFMKRAFGAEELQRDASPDGAVHHAKIKIQDSVLEMGDAHGDYQPMPTMFYLYVNDVDAAYDRAVRAGATADLPPKDQHYGEYVGSVSDPFGNRWYMASPGLRNPAVKSAPASSAGSSAPLKYIRDGFRTLTPYLLVHNAAKEIEFLKAALGAQELFRMARPGSDAIMHAQLRIGDAMVEMSDATAEFPARACVNILYVTDVDATYAQAMAAGAHSLSAPEMKPFGDRDAGFRGPGGVTWWISSRGPGEHITHDTPSLVPMFTVNDAANYIEFLKNAFGAEEAFMHKDSGGVVRHARVRIGNSILGGGEAHGPYQSAPFLMHMYVPDTDATYARALAAGATTVRGLEDAPYGDRTATVQDPAGNLWSLATRIRDVRY